MRTFSHRYLKLVAALTTLALGGVAAFNVLMDPFAAYPDLHIEAWDDVRSGRGTRSGKAELIGRGGYANLIMGSSRVEMGIDPSRETWPQGGAINAGLVGSSFYEHPFVYELAKESEDLERVYLFLDFYMFGLPSMPKADFQRSLLNPKASVMTYHLENMVGMHATKKSLSSFLRLATGRTADTDPLGFRSGDDIDSHGGVRRMSRKILRSITAPHNLSGFDYNQASLDALRELIVDVRESGRELIVAIPPKHVLYFETLYQLGLWDEWEAWKRDVTEFVAEANRLAQGTAPTLVWDFTLYNARTAEEIPNGDDALRMENFVEITHFNTTLGNEVVDVIVGQRSPGDLGAKIDVSNIEDHLALVRNQREHWLLGHREEVDFVRKSVYPGALKAGPTSVATRANRTGATNRIE